MRRSQTIRGARVSEALCQQARVLRREMTPAEHVLWPHLRGSALGGYHFRRQQVIGACIVDFYCHRVGLVIELDGEIHRFQQAADAQRNALLTGAGYDVLHITNQDVFADVQEVLRRILARCRTLEAGVEDT